MRDLIKQIRYRLRFGKHVKVREDTYISSGATIGAFSYIGRRCDIGVAQIGRYVSIGNNVSIGPGEHPTHFVSTSHHFHEHGDVLVKQQCVIGNDVWIGADAIVKRGVTVGDGAIIGANSFVSNDVEPFSIVVGSPARHLRFRFEPDVRAAITSSHWWEFSPKDARKMVDAITLQYELLN